MTSRQIIATISSIISLIAIIFLINFLISKKENFAKLPTYFEYDEKEQVFKENLSSLTMKSEEIQAWNETIFDLIRKYKIQDAEAARIYAYLSMAQKEAAFLSYNATKKFSGTLDPISCKIACLFFPNEYENFTILVYQGDKYSEKLADLVFKKFSLRLEEEKEESVKSPIKKGGEYWKGQKPYYGLDVGSWHPWELSLLDFYEESPPNQEVVIKELQKIKQEIKNLSQSQKKIIIYWAGGPGTITVPGIWLNKATQYMANKKVAFAQQLYVRSILSIAMEDALINSYQLKYNYWEKRPTMLDPSIITIIPNPNSPGFPSSNASASYAAQKILSFYFSESSAEWERMANEQSTSEIWAGIHFSTDIQASKIIGEKIATDVINKMSSQ